MAKLSLSERMGPRALRLLLDAGLLITFAISIVIITLTTEDPFLRDALCEAQLCVTSPHAASWNTIFHELAVGGAISIFFYWIIVWLPGWVRRAQIRRSFRKQYRIFKESCISIMIGVAQGSYSPDDVEELFDQKLFRDFFQDRGSNPGTTLWDDFANNLQWYHVDDLVVAMEVFRDEILFVINNTNVESDEVFEFLKNLLSVLSKMRRSDESYDSVKALCRFFWDVFAGWSSATGYRDFDIVEEMIDRI